MIVRKANLNDLDVIIDFNSNLALETEDKQLDKDILRKGIEKVLNGEIQGKYFVCEEEGIVIGQMMILYEWSDWWVLKY